MLASIATRDLYHQILGERWEHLDEAIRSAHQPGVEKTGHFRVTHGSGWIVRQLARQAMLPKHAETSEVTLQIRSEGGRETWDRRFDAEQFTTVQWGANGRLVERFGAWELHFTLSVSDGALVYEQCAAHLCLGALSMPVPMVCAPRVSARETACGANRVRVFVSVRLPILGSLITYDGYLDVGDLEP